MSKSRSQLFCERCIRLDRYYLEADAASSEWFDYKGSKEVKDALEKRHKKLWRRYRRACNQPMPV